MKKNNKTKQSLLLLVSLCSLNITAQEVWISTSVWLMQWNITTS